jgi:hypothetical protein
LANLSCGRHSRAIQFQPGATDKLQISLTTIGFRPPRPAPTYDILDREGAIARTDMTDRHNLLWGLILGAVLLPAAAGAATYKWVDDEGNVTYSQMPPSSGEYERISGAASGGPRPGSGEESMQKLRDAVADVDAENDEARKRAEVERTIAENEEIRQQNCEAARKNLEIYTTYRRFRDKDGEVTRLPEEERLKRLEEAKTQIETYCD